MAIAACLAAPVARAQLSGAQVIHGQASVVQQGANVVVTTQNGAGSNHSAINWQSFSVPAGTTARFNQPSAASTSINRVVGANPSNLFGTLSSNGKLVLVNPSGITVGTGAVVDTAGFTASTLAMSDADAIGGRLRFQSSGSVGALNVQGSVLARDGAVILAAGQSVEITGRGLEGIRLQVQAPADEAVNLGTLVGDAVGIFAGTLKHSGIIRAQTATLEGGRVVLRALKDVEIGPGAKVLAEGGPGQPGGSILITSAGGDVIIGSAAIISANAGEGAAAGAIHVEAATGSVRVAGTLTAMSVAQPAVGTAQAAAGLGGQVAVLGREVSLETGSGIDVSGNTGGGVILVGGDLQGKNPDVMNAQNTSVAAGVVLAADARVAGDGGKVIVWADNDTHFAGHLIARGGEQGGDGGSGETSGKHLLYFLGTADLAARRGRSGTLLLDPLNIIVGNTPAINGTIGDILTATDLDASSKYPGVNSQITATALTALLNTSNVTLAATNNITVNSIIAKTGLAASTLTLNATTVNINNTIGSVGGALNLAINTSGTATLSSTLQNGTLTVSSGALSLGSATFDAVTVGSNLVLSASSLNIKNGLTLANGVTFNTGATTLYYQGSQTIGVAGTGGAATLQRTGGVNYVNSRVASRRNVTR